MVRNLNIPDDDMKKIVALNICIITFTICFYIANYLLLRDNVFHISISSIINEANRLHGQSHLVILALLPIYIATMIFGASILGIYLGSIIHQFLLKRIKTKHLF